MNDKSIISMECESKSTPRSDNLRLSTARSIDLAHNFLFLIFNFKGGTELKTFHASPIKHISYDKLVIKLKLGSS